MIREIQIKDAESFNHLIKRIESESDFMLRDPGERKTTAEDQKNFIERLKLNPESRLLLAFSDKGTPIGFIMIMSEGVQKKKHSRYLAMGVLSEFCGQGWGSRLLEAAFEFAREQKVVRLELTVVTSNESAIGLYNKQGFQIEGLKKGSLLIQNELADEYQMSAFIM